MTCLGQKNSVWSTTTVPGFTPHLTPRHLNMFWNCWQVKLLPPEIYKYKAIFIIVLVSLKEIFELSVTHTDIDTLQSVVVRPFKKIPYYYFLRNSHDIAYK